MSLNFNYSKCRDSDELKTNPFDPDTINPITEAMIWNMMAIDMNDITEANVDEVWFRTALLMLTRDKCAVTYHNPGDEPVRVYLTRDDVVRHIGLSTNVGTLSRTKWLAKMYGDAKNSLGWLNLENHRQKKTAMQMVADQAEHFKAAQARKEANETE